MLNDIDRVVTKPLNLRWRDELLVDHRKPDLINKASGCHSTI